MRIPRDGSYLRKNKKFQLSGRKFLKIGLTGGMGSGKSTVLNLVQKRGVPVLQTDLIARRLLERKAVQKKITRIFGKEVFDKPGKIDRSKLGLKVFRDRKHQEALNRILHPLVRKEVSVWIEKKKKHPAPWWMVVVEVPLLFERGYFRFFDGVLSISAGMQIRQKRLLKRNWDLEEIKRREKFQWSQHHKDMMAHWIIFNNGALKELAGSVKKWLEIFRRKS